MLRWLKSPFRRVTLLFSLRVVRLQPGDVIVLHVPYSLESSTKATIGEQLHSHFPDHRCLIVDKGSRLGVVRNR